MPPQAVVNKAKKRKHLVNKVNKDTPSQDCSMGDEKEEQIKQRTYIMVKPDGVQRGLVGRVIQRFEDKGLKLVGLKLLEAQDEVLDQHYEELKEKPFYPGLIEYIKSGPVVAMVWEGQNVVQIGRNILGATNPVNAAPGTVRGDFGVEPGRNIAHGSDTTPATEECPSSADKEVALWFDEAELVEYDRCHKDWVYAM